MGLNYKDLNVQKRLILVCIGYTTKLYIVYFAVLSALIKYILLNCLVCRIADEPAGRVKLQTTSKNAQR